MNRTWEDYFTAACPRVMGIINLTPDSFHAPSRQDAAVRDELSRRILAMVDQGADMLDLGAESSRPGADFVPEDEEVRRLIPAVRLARSLCDLPISIDTRRATVARQALECGADIINDISAGREDNQAMLRLAAEKAVPLVLMHMQGEPRTMQLSPEYRDVVAEVLDFLRDRLASAETLGVRHVLVDPGIGFGKNLEHNLRLLASIDRIAALGRPVLIGHSRKTFLGKILAGKDANGELIDRPVDGRLAGGLGAAVWSALQGAAVIRTHDVAETVDALRVVAAIRDYREGGADA